MLDFFFFLTVHERKLREYVGLIIYFLVYGDETNNNNNTPFNAFNFQSIVPFMNLFYQSERLISVTFPVVLMNLQEPVCAGMFETLS